MKFVLVSLFLLSTTAFARSIMIEPGQAVRVSPETTVYCQAANEYVCGVEQFRSYNACEYAPYMMNTQTMEKWWIGSKTYNEREAWSIVRRYVANGQCKASY